MYATVAQDLAKLDRFPHSPWVGHETPLLEGAPLAASTPTLATMTSPSPPSTSSTSWRGVVIWAGAALVIGALNEYGLYVATPAVREAFELPVTSIGWMLLVFLIADAIVLIAAGKLGDRVGRAKVAVAGLALIAVGSLICAVAPSFGVILVGRVIEGIGVGALFSGLLAIIADAVPAESRGRAFGLWALIGAFAVFLSPLVGGALAEYLSWRWIFVLNAVISLVALAAARRYMSAAPPTREGAPAGRSSLLGSTNYAAGTAVMALIYATMALTGLLLVFFLTVVTGLGLTVTGLTIMAYAVWWLVLPPFTGRLADRAGVRTPMMIGTCLGAAGFAVLALGAGSRSMLVLSLGLCLVGIGVAFVIPAANAAAMGNVPSDIRGDASGINMTVRIVGSIAGLAVSIVLLRSLDANDIVAGAQTAWITALILMLIALAVTALGIKRAPSPPVEAPAEA